MNFFRHLLIILFFTSIAYADQNDRRLDELFSLLKVSNKDIEIDNLVANIWEIWLETNDPFIENDFRQGLTFMQNGQIHASIMFFTKVIKKNPDFAEAWNKRATAYYLIGNFESSIQDIYQTLRLEPRHFGAMDGLSLILIYEKKYNETVGVYNKMLKIFPHNLTILQKRHQILKIISTSI